VKERSKTGGHETHPLPPREVVRGLRSSGPPGTDGRGEMTLLGLALEIGLVLPT